MWSRTGEPEGPRIPPQGSRRAECETNPASGAEQAGEEGVTENPPSRERSRLGDRPSLRSSCSGREARARTEWACRQQRLDQPPPVSRGAPAPEAPATGVQQYAVGEPAEARREGLQEAWNFKFFPTKLLPFWPLFIVRYQYYVIFCLCDHVNINSCNYTLIPEI